MHVRVLLDRTGYGIETQFGRELNMDLERDFGGQLPAIGDDFRVKGSDRHMIRRRIFNQEGSPQSNWKPEWRLTTETFAQFMERIRIRKSHEKMQEERNDRIGEERGGTDASK